MKPTTRRVLAIAAGWLALTSCHPASAAGMTDAIEECRKLSASSLPMTCSSGATDDGIPIFSFGFYDNVTDADSDTLASVLDDVIHEVCQHRKIVVLLVRVSEQGASRVKVGGCTPAEGLHFADHWTDWKRAE